MKALTCAIVFLLQSQITFPQSGRWGLSEKDLPTYEYTGVLPFEAVDETGQDADLPEDPYFLLGNYRMTLITHVSGIYQFLTAERAWARINAAEQTNYGWNDAQIIFKNNKGSKRVLLTGINSIASDPALVKKKFGAGYAMYTYQLENQLSCTRMISVKPSPKINEGNPSFVITITLKNNRKIPLAIDYTERMLVNFVLNSTQYTEKSIRPLSYNANVTIDNNKQIALADITCRPNEFLVIPAPSERYTYDVDPPSVFMYAKNEHSGKVSASKDTLAASFSVSLKPRETTTFNVVIGLTKSDLLTDVDAQVNNLFNGADLRDLSEGLFADEWKKRLPDLSGEKNIIFKEEMLWNAHMIEASAKYSDYYHETFIPQGTVYSYYFGDNISNRDHLQAALAACYTNPELAKSILRYVIENSATDGEIKRGNSGFGYTPPSIYKESDEQLFFFNTIAEYLLITKDYAFLNEPVTYYPAQAGKKDLLLTVLKKYFIYLRDEIGLGQNGLVKMLNSDWSDSFFNDYSPDRYSGAAESHLNSAMVLAIFPKLIKVLEKAGNAQAVSFIIALKGYHALVEKNYMKDLDNRKFSARAYLNRKLKFGVDNVCLEPQGYLLQIPGLPKERKKEIYDYIKSRISTPEKIGVRTREKPLWGGHPDGEDGGIWFSLEYPLLLGVATFDKQEAWSLLMKFSFHNYAANYPDYWVGQWTAADEVNSTLYRPGLYAFWVPSHDYKRAFQGYCSHPHTWPLFCYFKLKE